MKNVCMFLTNSYENDSRVRRECDALIESGYKVKLINVRSVGGKNVSIEDSRINIVQIEQFSGSLKIVYGLYRSIRDLAYRIKENPSKYILAWPIMLALAPIYMFVRLIKLKSFFRGLKKISIILRMIKEGLRSEVDIYHSNDFDTLIQGFVCSKIFRRKILVYDSHEVQTKRTGYKKNRTIKIVEKFIVKRVDKMVMTTDTRAEYTENLYGVKPAVIHNYPNFIERNFKKNNFREYLDMDEDEPILLYQGGIQVGRGLENIIKAVPMINRGIIVFIGDGAIKEKLEKMVLDHDLGSRVRFVPKVDVDELLYYTQHAYLGFQVLQNICFNHYSTLSNKLFEYMMMEVPVIASDFPEIRKVVNGEKTGLCINPHEPENIAFAVNELLSNPRLYSELKANCRHAKQKYNWNGEKKKLLSLYDNLTVSITDKHRGLNSA